MILRETIDEIYQTARVEEVVGEFVALKKAGSNYKGKSPFVDERTPSFMVSPAKQIWKCFSTGKGGNVVSFLMEVEHFSYVEALKWLANKYNIEIKEDRQRTTEEIEEQSVRENLSVINSFACETFMENLHENQKGKAIGLSYFLERGFREDIIKKFQLGYCLDESDGFTRKAIQKGYKLDYLLKTGLTKVKDDRTFDFFRGRVMFPIHSVAGKVLGFGGRTLKADKKVAKYFNSPESELYNKSQILYGLYFAKNAIIKYDNCFLVEGYTDVISMHQAGVENVVASSGTSLTEEQIKLIKRYSENITILFDGDAAGIKASFRGIDMILKEGLNVKVVLFPDGEDPDSFAKKSTTEELKAYIDSNAKDFIVFKSDVLLADAGDDPLKKARLINDIVGSIAVIDDAIKRQVYAQECATIFDIPEPTILQEVIKTRQKKKDEQARQDERQKRLEERQKNQQSGVPQKPAETDRPPEEEMPIEAFLPPELAALVQAPTPTNLIEYYERYIIEILLKYGIYVVNTESQPEEESDTNIEPEQVEVSVIELVLYELERDKISFENKIYNLILNEYKDGFENDVLYMDEHFVKHPDIEVCREAVDLITEKYELSDWHGQNIFVPDKLKNLERDILSAIYTFKTVKVKNEVLQLQDQLNNLKEGEDYAEIIKRQQDLDKVRMLLADKLGRVIT
ncbi:MAG: DNA primase [Crocinitomicaceae bacterium]